MKKALVIQLFADATIVNQRKQFENLAEQNIQQQKEINKLIAKRDNSH